ncbi:MAG TPA: hypothetical protein VK947_01695 [Planococcus sp. (in: firmicutes)]|nr:hypothetical protein [Planococcus sp. (in: firmicutes)]
MTLLDINLLKQDDTSISFTWTETGDTCRVIRDEDEIYKGTDSFLIDKDLARGEYYTYTIERLDSEGAIAETVKMHTGTENEEKSFLNALESITLTTIISESRISIAWGKIQGIEEYHIYRDGKFLELSAKNQYTDRDIKGDREHTYWIRGKRPLPESEESFSEGKFVLARIFGLFNRRPSSKEPAMEDFWLTKKVGKLDHLLADRNLAEPKPRYFKWHFRYNTFLPDAVIENPNLLSPHRYFSGDGRGFDPESNQYRTKVEFAVELQDNKAILEYETDVGTTISYNWRKKFKKADVASADGIEFEEVDEGERTATVYLKHAVGNPITTAPDINYEVAAVFYHFGGYDISGIHDQSPNHEVYLKDNASEEWVSLHQTQTKGLAWMAGPIARQYWRMSNFE